MPASPETRPPLGALLGVALVLMTAVPPARAAAGATAAAAPASSSKPAPTATKTAAPSAPARTPAAGKAQPASDSTLRLSPLGAKPALRPATSPPPAAASIPAGKSSPAPPAGASATGAQAPSVKVVTGPAAKAPQRTPSSRPATVPTVRAAGGTGGVARTGATGTGARGVQAVAHLDQKVTYQYNALGRRDPFQPMIGGEFVGADVGGDAPVDVGGMKVVGIVWGTEDKFAMVEDGRGQSMVLRTGDKVMNGVVESLRRDAVVIRITTDGTTQSVAIPLTRKGDKSNATR